MTRFTEIFKNIDFGPKKNLLNPILSTVTYWDPLINAWHNKQI